MYVYIYVCIYIYIYTYIDKDVITSSLSYISEHLCELIYEPLCENLYEHLSEHLCKYLCERVVKSWLHYTGASQLQAVALGKEFVTVFVMFFVKVILNPPTHHVCL